MKRASHRGTVRDWHLFSLTATAGRPRQSMATVLPSPSLLTVVQHTTGMQPSAPAALEGLKPLFPP